MTEPLRIFVFSTYISIPTSINGAVVSKGQIGHIRDVLDNLREVEFVPRFKRYIVKSRFYGYNPEEGETYLPRHALDILKTCLEEQNLIYEIEEVSPITAAPITIKIKDKFEDRADQINTIKYLASQDSAMRGVKDQTGAGKSFMTIRAISELKLRALIVCEGNLQLQWKKEILDKSNLKDDDIYIIQGAGSLVKLFKKKLQPKIFVASIDTLRSYIVNNNPPYNLIPSYQEFLELYGIGIKVIDEFHLNFSIITTIDLRSNVENNIYLSATPKRSSKQEERIFNLIFPEAVIEGRKTYEKYVKIYFYRYALEFRKQEDFNTVHGYSHVKYEQYIQDHSAVRQRFMDRVLVPLVNSHFVHKFKPGYKLLIFCKTVAFCDMVQAYLESLFPKMDIRTYTQKDPEENLKEADIIVSTPQSCGTGKDIKNLVTVIQTCSLGSAPLIEQILGRIRKPKDDAVTEFVDIWNKGLGRHYVHYKTRSLIYKERALTYTEHDLI